MKFKFLFSLFLILFLVSLPSCSETSTKNDLPEGDSDTISLPKIVAIGDIHGDIGALRDILQETGLISKKDHWKGGKTILVQTGDLLDRKDDEIEIIAFFENLKIEAKAEGGQVITLLGNHEVYAVTGDFSSTSEKAIISYEEKLNITREAAYAPGGIYALKLADFPVVLNISGNIFLHGGVLPEHVGMGFDIINDKFSNWLKGTEKKPSETLMETVLTRVYSENLDCKLLETTLNLLNAKRMIVGHTVQSKIKSECGDKLFLIDTGMSSYFDGPKQALVIESGKTYIIE